jgi:hypothetical protein
MNPKKQINQEQPVVEPTEVEVQVVQEIAEAAKEVDASTEAKVEEGPKESKEERIVKLLQRLAESKKVKDDRAGKKIRRQLRKLGYYISKQVKPE